MKRARLLIADDDSELTRTLARRFQEAGWETEVVTRGRAALEAIVARQPSAAVVAVLLPDMMGYDVAEALRKARIPFGFVTSVFKGPRAAAEARSRHGASAYVEKPVTEAGVAELLRALPIPEGAAPGAAFLAPAHTPPPLSAEPDLGEQEGVEILVDDGTDGSEVVAAPAPSVPGAPAPPPMALEAPEAAPELPPTGPLADNLPRLITSIWRAGRNGELLLRRGPVRKTIHFEEGRRAFARSNVTGDRFAQILIRVGKISKDEVQRLGDEAFAARRRLGDLLVERGILDPQERVHYLGQQVKAIIYSTFGWEEGEYRLVLDDARSEEAVQVDLDPVNLIARGVRKLYRPERLLRLIAPNEVLAPVANPPFPRADLKVQPWEGELLGLVDGRRTVVELRAAVRRSAPEVNAVLHVATVLGMVARVRQ